MNSRVHGGGNMHREFLLRQNPGSAGCGGIIRNDAGGFIVAFTYAVEFHALERGIALAMELNYKPIVTESDSKLLVDFICQCCRPHWRLRLTLVNSISKLAAFADQHWKVQHVYWKANMAADSLTKAAVSLNEATVWRARPPDFVMPFILSDVASFPMTKVA
ncbi:uncharacterized protein LOC105421364 [Amborella trichopoda]|uniref:uncharacterized protein LOC105421364 n=1 Tax=Amborella trichopoda TaxID=13333 RepID=UPI0005D3AC42|nr:uncharacterized protein LOC105421364 [Amborella trichopoda]|eukprot:XP_011626812.1 uncharacterized protein LOC105421364 [Amborella trichopoda]